MTQTRTVSEMSSLCKAADALVPGGITQFLERYRAEDRKRPWRWIAKKLFEDTGGRVDVSEVTVADWAEKLGVETSSGKASEG